jgi:hypothetical protein
VEYQNRGSQDKKEIKIEEINKFLQELKWMTFFLF